ncbi:hypothetical protein K8Z61_11315 [Nocardioides sp. TRM66260-LWL]|uniref:hypothetical protein n=1 Tax=Nocardioides sp. TRM66260-LWL TaxID=2874478 RepID=UPI001CC6BE1E|nr:hypothetical protein [Nocardioides sp. TRM66260-LWL]MBZ5735088.1 hypothetical protein [Nocardioides sp. TRM66260-LWL]
MSTARGRRAPRTVARRGTGLRRTLAVTLALAIGVIGAVALGVDRLVKPYLGLRGCVATVDGRSVSLSLEQAENASVIAAVGVRRGLPARAVSIALATAYQESKIRNLAGGDRDSLGLFQQRPSQGWGTPEEIRDPVYAANAFYDALEKVPDYRSLEITQAAQAVQRSGFPDAYADHEDDARVLASALTGFSPHALTCTVEPSADAASGDLDRSGLTPRAARVRTELEDVFGRQSLGGFAPGGVRTGHMPGSAHYDGRAVDVFFRPITPARRVDGWAVAQFLVAQASRLQIATVIYDGMIWTARRSGQGWRPYSPASRSGDRAILEHRDHVHVDVFA